MQKNNIQKTLILLLLAALACDTSGIVPTLLTALPITPVPTALTLVPTQPLPPGSLQQIPLSVGYGARGSFYEIYFTDPFNPETEKQEGGPDLPLAQAIDEARLSVDVAAYSLSLRTVRDALLRAQKRGIQVRLVMETTNTFDLVPKSLIDAGIPIIGDNRDGLMHDKFVIIDRSEVWTGSLNFTTPGAYADNNNLIRIRSQKVAQNYTVEFEEMFKRDFFGPDIIAATPYPRLTIDGVPLEIYFSPDDRVVNRILDLLRGAQRSVHFMAFSFTTLDFGEILLQKARMGLTISGVMEEQQIKSNEGTRFTPFQQAGLPVYQDGNPGQMHHKVIIIDEKIVITGSYNFSASAENTNDENVIIFFDPQIAALYMEEFKRVEAEAQK